MTKSAALQSSRRPAAPQHDQRAVGASEKPGSCVAAATSTAKEIGSAMALFAESATCRAGATAATTGFRERRFFAEIALTCEAISDEQLCGRTAIIPTR